MRCILQVKYYMRMRVRTCVTVYACVRECERAFVPV